MFWGLIMEPQKRYSQVIKRAFHISMASLDISNSDDEPAQVLCGYEGKNYLLCTLQRPNRLQCNLDLYFEEGCTVSFASNGKSHIHLTGYLTKDDDPADDGLDYVPDSDEEGFEVTSKKNVRSREEKEKQSPSKKIKLDQVVEEEDESDDSDFNIEQLLEEEESGVSEEEEDIDDLSDVDMEEEDESMGEEDDDSEDGGEEEEEDDEEQKIEEKVQQNGVSKKLKKNKKEEQPTTPTKKNKQNKEKPQLTPGPKPKKDKSEDQKNKGKEEKKAKDNQSPVPKKKTLANGIIIEDLKVGQGDAASNGKFIHVYYEGRLKSNNKVFDKSLNGPGFGFRLGKGEVIKGWDIGVNGMKIGGKRRIICPPQTAYGAKGSPPVIPPNATLVFDVELKKIK